jgi:hypothetical protein
MPDVELRPGRKIVVRSQYTVQIGGDIFLEGEQITVTPRNIAELELQRWRYEFVKEKGEEETKMEDVVANRAILKPEGRTRIKSNGKKSDLLEDTETEEE